MFLELVTHLMKNCFVKILCKTEHCYFNCMKMNCIILYTSLIGYGLVNVVGVSHPPNEIVISKDFV